MNRQVAEFLLFILESSLYVPCLGVCKLFFD